MIRRNPYLKKALLVIGACVVLFVLYMVVMKTSDEVMAVALVTSSWITDLRLFRWSMIALLIGFWPQLMVQLAHYKNLTEQQLEHALSLRWRTLAALVVFELLIIEQVPAQLLG